MSDKRFVSQIYEELLQSNKSNNNIFKWAKDFNSYFTKENTQIIKKHMKTCVYTKTYM